MNYQRDRWTMYFSGGIFDTFKEFFEDCTYKGVKITCVPDASKITSLQRQGNSQEYAPLYVTFSAENINNNTDMQTITSPAILLLDIPYFAEDGFKGLEASQRPVSRLEYASGWYISPKEKDENGYNYRLTYRSKYRREFYFTDDVYVKSAVTKKKVPILIFLKAVTGMSFSELMNFYPFEQITNYVFNSSSINKMVNIDCAEPDRTDCCKIVFDAFQLKPDQNRSNADYVDNLANFLFKSPFQKADSEKIPRYLDMESYHRFHGFIIKKIIDGSNIPDTISEGILISDTIANTLDNACELRECILTNSEGKDIVVKRMYSDNLTRNLSANEILYAYYQFLLFLNGVGTVHDSQELSNLILVPLDRVARKAIEYALIVALKYIHTNIDNSNINPFKGLSKHMLSVRTDKNEANTRKRMSILDIIKNDNSDRTLDITNIVSETDMGGKVKREKSDAQRDVHPSHYGRLDMNDTPESIEVGHTVSLCSHSDIDKYGFITVPLYRVINGKVDTSKTVHLSYLDEKWKYIAPVSVNLDDYGDNDLVPNCTFNGQVVKALKSAISYKRRNSEDYYGSTLNTVPLITSNGVKRFTLASSGYKQATPLLAPERPWVSTGFGGNDIGVVRAKDIITEYFKTLGKYDIQIPNDITLTLASWVPGDKHVEATFKLNIPIEGASYVKFTTLGVSRSMTNTMRQYKLASGDRTTAYSKNDIVLYSNDVSIDTSRGIQAVEGSSLCHGNSKGKDHDFALGQNARILYKTFEGFGYEDSVQINERFVNKFGLSTVFTINVKADTSGGLDSNRKLEFKQISSYRGKSITWLDERGLPKLGTYLKPGDVVIGRVETSNGQESPRPVELTVNQEGHVWYTNIHKSKDGTCEVADVILAKIIPMDIGDKLTGGHGNKATVSRVLKEHEMPYFEDGTTPDIIFDPLGCIARENVGQVTECLLAEIGRTNNTTMVVNQGASTNPDDLVNMAGSNITKQTIYNPKTGEPYKEKAFIGTMYIVRSTHTCFSKYMVLGSQKHLSMNFQPIREGPEHAQRVSEQTTWWYRAAGGEEVLNSLFSVQSDDTVTFEKMYSAISKGEDFGLNEDEMYESVNGYRIQAYARFFGLNIVVDKENQTSYIEPINTARAEELFGTKSIIVTTSDKDVNTLYNPELFGTSKLVKKSLRENLQKYGLIKVSQEFINPVFINSSEFTRCIPTLKVTIKRVSGDICHDCEFCGLSSNEAKAIINTSVKDSHLLFGTINVPIDVKVKCKVNGSNLTVDTTVNKVFILVKTDYVRNKLGLSETEIRTYIEDNFQCTNLCHGTSAFFSILANENLYDLRGAYDIYKSIYGGMDIIYEDSQKSMSASEDDITRQITRDSSSNSFAETMDESSVDEAITQASATMDMARLEEMLFVTNRTIKSYMTQYVIVPPLILRPVGNKRNPARAFTKVLHNIFTSASDIRAVYNFLDQETKPKKSKNKNSSAKTVIQEFTSHSTKTSVLRDSVLAKPVSYSGRSVISVDPTLKLGEAKVPAIMLVTIFKDHLIALVEKSVNTKLYACVPKRSDGSIDKKAVGNILSSVVNCDLATTVNRFAFISDLSDASDYSDYSVKEKDELFNNLKNEIYDMLIELSEKYPILLSRDPALWILSIRGVKFIPATGYTIRIHPLLCMGFNADFDGDQMSCIVPMHAHAREVVFNNMMVGQPLINPQEVTSVFEFAQDVLLGQYFATRDEPDYSGISKGTLEGITDIITLETNVNYSFNFDADVYVNDIIFNRVNDLYVKVEMGLRSFGDTVLVCYDNKKYLTTIGRLIYNTMFPLKYVFTDNPDTIGGFYKLRFDVINKSKVKSFTSFILEMQKLERDGNFVDSDNNNAKGIEIYRSGLNGMVIRVADRLMKFGFACADLSGITLSYWDFADTRDKRIDTLVEEATKKADEITIRRKLGLLDDDMANSNLKRIWNDVKKESESMLAKRLHKSPNLELMITSGARGSISNLNNICGFIGTVVNSSGEEMPEPIKGNFLNGLNNEEVAINSFNGRSVKIHTQQGSSKHGEKMRHLVYLLEHFKINEDSKYTCDAKPTVLDLIYDVSFDTSELIIFSDTPTSDMTPDEADTYINFINTLRLSNLNLLDTEETKQALIDLEVEYVAINGVDTKVKVKKTLCNEHCNMLRYRTIDIPSLPMIYQEEIKDACMSDFTLGKANYIITDKAITVIEKYHLSYVPFYTMINCRCGDGTICPRCFGYRYEDFRYPEGNTQIGYTVAGSISQRGLQAAQNLHKSGGNSKKTTNLYSINAEKAFSAPIDLNSKVDSIPDEDIVEIYKELVRCSKFEFPKYYNDFDWYKANKGIDDDTIVESDTDVESLVSEVKAFKKQMSTVSRFDNGIVKLFKSHDMVIVEVCDYDIDNNLVDFTWFPIWNQGIQINVTHNTPIDKGYSIVKLPVIKHMLDLCNHSDANEQFELSSKLAMAMWYTTVKSNSGFAARNFELTTKAFTEVGTAQESNHKLGIVAGRDYPIYKLNEAGVRYLNTIPSDFNVTRNRGKVFATMALGKFLSKAASCAVMKTMSEKTSSMSDAVVGIDRYQDSFPETFSTIDKAYSSISNIVDTSFSTIAKNNMALEDKNNETTKLKELPVAESEVIDDYSEPYVPYENSVEEIVDAEVIDVIDNNTEDDIEEAENIEVVDDVVDADIVDDTPFGIFDSIDLSQYEDDDDDYDYKRRKKNKRDRKNKKHTDGETSFF